MKWMDEKGIKQFSQIKKVQKLCSHTPPYKKDIRFLLTNHWNFISIFYSLNLKKN